MNPGKLKDGRTESIVIDIATRFISRESSGFSLITVTGVRLEDRAAKATILVTVLPDAEREAALQFLKRKRSVFRDFVRDNTRLPRIPIFDFALDRGEINRQRIDELTNVPPPETK